MVSCREIINLHSLAKLKIVAGKDGLYHQVRWVHFIDLPDVLPWVQGGELLIITGIALNGDMRGLTTLVQGLIHKNIAGIIINVGPYIKEIPDEVIKIADAANFPVFELPWEVKIVEVTQDICSYIVLKQTEKHLIYNFFEQLLLQPVEDSENLVERAGAYGYDLSKPQQIVIFSPSNLEKYVQEEKIKDEFAIVALKTQLEQLIRDILVMQGKKLLVTLWMDKVVLLLPTDAKTTKQQSNFAFVTEIIEKLNEKFPRYGIVASLGGTAKTLREVRRSYVQGNKALWLAESTATVKSVYEYEKLGIYKLLFEIPNEKLKEYYDEVIEPLNEYDRKYKMDLVLSLFVYFEENGNVVRTAKRLYLHRNTLDYRLKKIEEITGKKLNNPYDRLTLQLGVIVGKQMKFGFLMQE